MEERPKLNALGRRQAGDIGLPGVADPPFDGATPVSDQVGYFNQRKPWIIGGLTIGALVVLVVVVERVI